MREKKPTPFTKSTPDIKLLEHTQLFFLTHSSLFLKDMLSDSIMVVNAYQAWLNAEDQYRVRMGNLFDFTSSQKTASCHTPPSSKWRVSAISLDGYSATVVLLMTFLRRFLDLQLPMLLICWNKKSKRSTPSHSLVNRQLTFTRNTQHSFWIFNSASSCLTKFTTVCETLFGHATENTSTLMMANRNTGNHEVFKSVLVSGNTPPPDSFHANLVYFLS